jgi:hypothetical protein
VPVPQAGTAGGLLQTGQRIGAAVGIAAVGAVFFAAAGRGRDYAGAYQRSVLVSVVFVAAALAVTIADLVVDHHIRAGRDQPGRSGEMAGTAGTRTGGR